jgi:tetratricopeptide (TPR) repeat protein
MVAKAKSESAPKPKPAPAQHQSSPLNEALAKALKLLQGAKYPEAGKALEALLQDAQAAGDWTMKRRAQVYLALVDSKLNPPKAAAADPITEIQACLNRRDTDGAIKLSEKALKGHPNQGVLHYLRAIAFAQAENADASAECMKKAVELDGDFVFQWFMEPDFNPIRKSPLFAFTEGR